ncbi:MAG: UDP-N-acetylmuramoyl-L-alanine--D-glutamate ligase [Planctomycetia bacterium]|nr:UDP-N-acetylmuramoyl-L-alanine--D-glutamate ligase [Planctomycetia bacterium]
MDWRGQHVTVMGLGKFGGGIGAARYLAQRGAEVTVTDLKGRDALADSIARLGSLRLTLHLGEHRPEDFTGADVVVVSPAVPKDSKYLALARDAGAAITAEMNLFFLACPAPIAGITGTSGKSTTTALLGAMLSRCRTTLVGGNIGVSLLPEADQITPEHIVVLELSSFQLEDLAEIRRSPELAVVTNISENHIDRHKTMEAYISAKKNILRFQEPEATAVLNWDDAEVRSWRPEARGQVVFYSRDASLEEGVFLEANRMVFRFGGRMEEIEMPGKLPLFGKHNLSNILAAAAGAYLLGVPPEDIIAAVASFEALPHRLQTVAKVGGVLWVNDSKATTPAAAIVAMEAFKEPIVLIAGGYDKKVDLAPLADAIRRRTRAVVLMGRTAEKLEGLIVDARGSAAAPEVVRVGSLHEAVAECDRIARPGDVVLLSTAHASWDMFENYEQRGDMFAEEVKQLKAPKA